MKLEEVSRGRKNNLDLIRFFAAIAVILCHAFPLTRGEGIPDSLSALTDDQLSFGSLAVGIFFLYGGFLICKSMCRLQTAKRYFKARILRIFPMLIVVTVVLAFVAGPVLTELPVSEYFKSSGTYRYLLNGILFLQHNLPGVFVNNIYGQPVNGPLWTLPVEFLCYVMCFVMYKLKLLDKKNMKWAVILFSAGCIGVKVISGSIPALAPMIRPMGLFFAGMLYYVYRDKIPMRLSWCMVSFAGMVISLLTGIFPYTVFVFFSYFFLYLGYATKWKCSGFAKHGEVSYGMYLCAWPVQQILVQLSGNKMSAWVNFILTIPIAILIGFIGCKLIEEPIAKWAKKSRENQEV